LVHDEPEPGPGQELLGVRAASLSLRELLVLDGNYPLPVLPDTIPGCTGVGEVAAIGSGVTWVEPGAGRPGGRNRVPTGSTARSAWRTPLNSAARATAYSPSSR
jgi:NADPH:quinone reductase-like Zn-dependent oxidoreductase